MSRKYRVLECLLVAHGRDCQPVRVNKQGDTLLMLAIRCQYEPAVQLLLSHNAANPNLTNTSGSSALDLALLASTSPANHMDHYIRLLSCISRQVSSGVLTSVLDPGAQDPARVVHTAALLVHHSPHYAVRAKVLHTLLKYYPGLVQPLLAEGTDPTGVTDPRIDTQRLWQEVVNLHYFKHSILEIIPQSLTLLLIRAANGCSALDLLAAFVVSSIQAARSTPANVDFQFHHDAVGMLVTAGCRFSPDEMEIIEANLPEVAEWYLQFHKQASSLRSLARQTVRSVMHFNVIYGSSQLPLPVVVQQYLCLE